MTHTGLIAADAGANFVNPVLCHLIGELRIRNQGPNETDHVCLALVQDLSSALGLIDPSGDQYGFGDLGF